MQNSLYPLSNANYNQIITKYKHLIFVGLIAGVQMFDAVSCQRFSIVRMLCIDTIAIIHGNKCSKKRSSLFFSFLSLFFIYLWFCPRDSFIALAKADVMSQLRQILINALPFNFCFYRHESSNVIILSSPTNFNLSRVYAHIIFSCPVMFFVLIFFIIFSVVPFPIDNKLNVINSERNFSRT